MYLRDMDWQPEFFFGDGREGLRAVRPIISVFHDTAKKNARLELEPESFRVLAFPL
jgi:hypothetical protein